MSYRLRYQVQIDWVGDGIGAMEGSSGGQTISFSATVPVAFVPGANSPTQGNFNTALSGSSATPTSPSLSYDVATQIATKLAQIQAWSTGGN